jgi:3-oxoacyl-[acyl-carrier-protein] synthase II
MGLLTPAGGTPESVWEVMCAGRSLAATDPVLAGLPVDISCQVRDYDPVAVLGRRVARRLDPVTHMALSAARSAVDDAKLDPAAWASSRIGVIFGVGSNSLHTYIREIVRLDQGRPHHVSPTTLPRSLPNLVAAEVALDLQVRGPSFTVSSACASGATAIGVAADLITSGTCDIVLAGGSESGRARATATGFAQMQALSRRTNQPGLASRPFDTERDGFVLSEGAAVLVLEHPDNALARGAHIRAMLRAHASSSDAYHSVAPHPQAEGAVQALRDVLALAGLRPRDIGHVNAHGTSTPVGDTAEAVGLLRVFDGQPPPVTAPKSILGHSLGAASAIEAALTVLTLEHQLIPPTANLISQETGSELDIVTGCPRPAPMEAAVSSAFGFGGQNTILLFTTP